MNKSSSASANADAKQSPRVQPATLPEPTDKETDAVLFGRIMQLGIDRNPAAAPVLFADPRWEMLVELHVRASLGKSTQIGQLVSIGAIAPTTGLRYLRRLETAGLVERLPDPTDARRIFIQIRDEGREIVTTYFASLRALVRAAHD
jgi:DNA-binding MarR family transcriptional regulator